MLKYIIRRLLLAIPVLFAIVVVTFGFSHAMPGGPFSASGQRRLPPNVSARLEQQFGLNKPVFFNLPSDGSGSETVWGETLSVRGHSDTGYETTTFPEIEGGGVRLFGDYDLVAYEGDQCPPGQDVEPGWALISRRETCVVTGGSVNQTFTEVRESWHIDILDAQFWIYLGNVATLDFGPSLNLAKVQENKLVIDDFRERIPVSMQLGLVSSIVGFTLGIPLGVVAALYHNTVIDYLATFTAVLGQSISSIVLAPILIIFFAVRLDLVPVADPLIWKEANFSSWDNFFTFFSLDYLKALILPVMTISTGMSAGIARLTRATLLQVLGEDYIRTARAKGMRERTVIYLHALKNSLIPVVTGFGGLLASIVAGSFIVELIFSIPGMGNTTIDAVAARDYTTIMGATIFFSTILIMGNILVDVMYTWLDPRIRFD
jgi:ABC-type dipeptide/oligopeptide/nickel transport system permease component